MERKKLSVDLNGKQFRHNLVLFSKNKSAFCLLDGKGFTSFNNPEFPGLNRDRIALAAMGMISEVVSSETGSFLKLESFIKNKKDWLFGFLSYDLKNDLEKLSSENPDFLNFPDLHFFQPELVFDISEKEVSVYYHGLNNSEKQISELLDEIQNFHAGRAVHSGVISENPICCRFTRQEYLDAIEKLKKHILLGDVYEINFCMEFFSENIFIQPEFIFNELLGVVAMPFSCFYKYEDRFLMSASPERFLRKEGKNIFSQPMKGTMRRGAGEEEDNRLKIKLKNDKKERSENVMIVDLVRNDLSKIAKPSSVHVEELFGVYSFPNVHQMISTVSAEVKEGINFTDVLRAAFPMGSMTGAPKVRAMELIEKVERSKRGLFSGSVGYISPDGNFDFNVVIRSLLYNHVNQYLSYQAGSAITFHSVAEKEYEECMLKAKTFFTLMNFQESKSC